MTNLLMKVNGRAINNAAGDYVTIMAVDTFRDITTYDEAAAIWIRDIHNRLGITYNTISNNYSIIEYSLELAEFAKEAAKEFFDVPYASMQQAAETAYSLNLFLLLENNERSDYFYV